MISPKPKLDLIQDLIGSTEVLHGHSKKKLHNFLLNLNQRLSEIELNHTPTFVRETPDGDITGRIFSLSKAPVAQSLNLYKVVIGTGLVQLIPGTDYTISLNIIKLSAAPGVELLAMYRY